MDKAKVSVHKFASCDGCQLAFLNLGEPLLDLTAAVEIVHFAEAGYVAPDAHADIAFIEGSVSTPEEADRIRRVRENSSMLITIGACATNGGLQSLRNFANVSEWVNAIYEKPEFINVLDRAEPIKNFVKVDFEIWGCPITSEQLIAVVRSYLLGASPLSSSEKVCLECKKRGNVCVMVTSQQACMGPVTRAGCKAICPEFGRACYHCFGPQENINDDALKRRFTELNIGPRRIQNHFNMIHHRHTDLHQLGSQTMQRDGK